MQGEHAEQDAGAGGHMRPVLVNEREEAEGPKAAEGEQNPGVQDGSPSATRGPRLPSCSDVCCPLGDVARRCAASGLSQTSI